MDVSFEALLAELNAAPSAIPVPLTAPSMLDQPLHSSRAAAGDRPPRSTRAAEDPGPAHEISPGVFEYNKVFGSYPIWLDAWTSGKPGDICVRFEAKAPSDIALCFSAHKNSAEGTVFELVIGGWKNTKSVIRTKAQGTERAVSTQPRTCALEYRSYWATLRDGVVACGLGQVVGQGVIVAWKDPSYASEFANGAVEPSWVSFTTWDHTMHVCSVHVTANESDVGLSDVAMADFTPNYARFS